MNKLSVVNPTLAIFFIHIHPEWPEQIFELSDSFYLVWVLSMAWMTLLESFKFFRNKIWRTSMVILFYGPWISVPSLINVTAGSSFAR